MDPRPSSRPIEHDPLTGLPAFTELWEMPDLAGANHLPTDEDWEWQEISRNRLAIARKWAPFFLTGVVANSVLCIAVLWSSFRLDTLALWGLLHATAAAVVGLSLLTAKAPDRQTESGLPRPALLGALAIGGLWGLPIWLDGTASRNELAQWQTGAFLLLTTFLVITFLEGARTLSRNVLLPGWTLFGLGLGLFGELALAVGACGLLLVVGIGLHMRGVASDNALQDRTHLDHQARAATWQANHDALTGALNRHGLRHHLDRPDLDSSHFVLLVSLDQFSVVNDRFGINVGDSALREVAHRLSRLIDRQCCVARVSGDEFVVLMPGRDPDAAMTLANEITKRIGDPMYRGNDEFSVAATIGVTQALGRPFDLGRALRESNAALRKATRTQRGGALLFTQDMEKRLEERMVLESGLHRALVHGEIQVWGQPIVDLNQCAVSHVELVARWIRNDGSRVPPSVFVPLAEQIGVIGDLTDHMLRGAGQALVTFDDHLWLRNAGVVVNARVEEIQRRDMIPTVKAVLQDFDIEPGRLNIGLKGSRTISSDEALDLFAKLSALGVGFGMDELRDGAGWLEEVEDLHAGVLRLDKALIKGARESDSQRDLVQAMARLGADLGFHVVAEGIEEAAAARFVQRLGVRYAQGFLFARAMPLDRLVSEETASQLAHTLREFTPDDAHAVSDLAPHLRLARD